MKILNKNNHNSYFSKQAWHYYTRFFKGQYHKLIATSLASTIQAFLILPTLFLVKYIFDKAIPEKQIDILLLIGAALIVLRLLNSGITLILRKINIKIITTAIFRLREHLLIKLYCLSRNYHTREDQRILPTQIVQDTERINRMSMALVSRLIPAALISFGLCLVLLFLNWYLFVLILLVFPILFFSNRYTGKIVKKRVFQFQRAFEGFSKGIMFTLKFMDLIKIQSAEKQETEKQINNLNTLKEKSTRMSYFFTVNAQLQNFIVGISGIIILVVGGISVARDVMTLGDFFAFYIAANQLNNNINIITDAFANILTGNESLVTLYNIAANTETEPYSGSKKIDFRGNISLESVSFQYTENPVLKGISLLIKPGDHIAIIGANGAGKSTIINLILGFYAPGKGSIMADDTPFADLDFQFFRQHIGVVSQNPLLIPGTVRENIIFGSGEIKEEDLQKVSGFVLAHDFIRELPEGYDTQIGEDGVLLSGGERQRVAIARALLRHPKLLILDEPTNHLDNASVKEIMQNLQSIEYKPSILLISHDMSVVNYAEKTFMLEDGLLRPYNS